VFSPLWDCPSVVVDARRVDGKVFQIVGPETAKLRGP